MTENPIAEQLTQAQHEVEALRAQIDRLTRQFEVARARLDAFQVAAQAFADAAPRVAPKVAKSHRQRAPRQRVRDEWWANLFQALLLSYQAPYSYDDIMKAAISARVAIKRDSLRTKMMNFVNDGFAERVDDGKFTITPKGMQFFKIQAASGRPN